MQRGEKWCEQWPTPGHLQRCLSSWVHSSHPTACPAEATGPSLRPLGGRGSMASAFSSKPGPTQQRAGGAGLPVSFKTHCPGALLSRGPPGCPPPAPRPALPIPLPGSMGSGGQAWGEAEECGVSHTHTRTHTPHPQLLLCTFLSPRPLSWEDEPPAWLLGLDLCCLSSLLEGAGRGPTQGGLTLPTCNTTYHTPPDGGEGKGR